MPTLDCGGKNVIVTQLFIFLTPPSFAHQAQSGDESTICGGGQSLDKVVITCHDHILLNSLFIVDMSLVSKT